jgi:ribose 1,5-bisphosphokinase PhnN
MVCTPHAEPRPVLVIVGPSGAGKSTLAAELHRLAAVRVHPTWTTRPARPAEAANGSVEHRFVPDAVFDRLDERGFFVDVARPFGLAYRYGLPHVRRRTTGPVDTVLLRAPYLPRLAPHLGRTVVYQVEAAADRIVDRLATRRVSPSESHARRAHDEAEVETGRRLAQRVLPNDGGLADLVARARRAIATDFSGRELGGAA